MNTIHDAIINNNLFNIVDTKLNTNCKDYLVFYNAFYFDIFSAEDYANQKLDYFTDLINDFNLKSEQDYVIVSCSNNIHIYITLEVAYRIVKWYEFNSYCDEYSLQNTKKILETYLNINPIEVTKNTNETYTVYYRQNYVTCYCSQTYRFSEEFNSLNNAKDFANMILSRNDNNENDEMRWYIDGIYKSSDNLFQ